MSTHNIPFSNMKKKIILNYPKSAAMGFGTQERVRNSRGQRTISVRAFEVLLYRDLGKGSICRLFQDSPIKNPLLLHQDSLTKAVPMRTQRMIKGRFITACYEQNFHRKLLSVHVDNQIP